MGFTFDGDAARKADAGGKISTGGVYNGEITDCKTFKTQGGASGLEFSVKDNLSGSTCDFVRVFTKNKDGTENFARAKIMALMGILGLSEAKEVSHIENGEQFYRFPCFTCKPVAFVLRREDYKKNDGDIGYRMDVLHWLYSDTLQTYAEKMEGIPAQVATFPVEDKRMHAKKNDDWDVPESAGSQLPTEDDPSLPF